MNVLKSAIIFVSGLAVGAGAAYVILKEKFNNDVQREVNQYKEDLKAREERTKDNKEDVEEVEVNDAPDAEELAKAHMNKPSIEDVAKMNDIVKQKNYSTYSTPGKDDKILTKEDNKMLEPYPISYDRYINDKRYMNETLTYYDSNDVLADAADQVLDIDEYIGRESLEHMGDEEDDVVYVRNELKEMDYEVICSHVDFDELVGSEEEDD